MRDRPDSTDRIATEAVHWVSRLDKTTITTAELTEFRRWRAEPGHREAYEKAEADWKAAAPLASVPDVQTILAKDDRRKTKGKRTPRPPRGAIIVGGLVVLSAGLAGLISLRDHAGETFVTAVGKQLNVTLSDGSHVKLDTDTRIHVRYAQNERQIDLVRGRALFDVVHDPIRPLTVKVGSTTIRDLGTRFIVGQENAHTAVTVLEGVVQVTGENATSAQRLTGGQALLVDHTIGQPTPANVAAAQSWTTGRLVFNDLPLASAIAEINRYNQRKLRIGPAVPDSLHVSGAFTADDPDRFAAALVELYNLKADAAPNGDVLLRRSEDPPLTP